MRALFASDALSLECAPVAQLDRANASGALGREFESLRAHHFLLIPLPNSNCMSGSRRGFTPHSQLFHDGLDQRFGAFHAFEHGLEVEGGLGWIAVRCAVDAVLAYEDERVREQVEGNSQTPAFEAHHELMLLNLAVLLVEYIHASSVSESRRIYTVSSLVIL